jgi:3-isopropylmalate dehydratase small subunit
MRVTVTKVELTDADIKHINIRIVAARKYADIYRNEILNKNKYV